MNTENLAWRDLSADPNADEILSTWLDRGPDAVLEKYGAVLRWRDSVT